MTSAERLRKKNEATGIRVVSQYVQEFWECGWQPVDQRNDFGIDGHIIMKKKGLELGVKINVQVKCGSSYVTSLQAQEIRISFDDESSLDKHLTYWKTQVEPCILVFVNPSDPKRDSNGNIIRSRSGKPEWIDNRLQPTAWWVDLKDKDLRVPNTKTTIRIPKNQTFGEHSKGNFLKLITPLLINDHLPEITPNEESRNLLNANNVKQEARIFYKSWKNSQSPNSKIVEVSRTGWRHILLARRGKERRMNSLKLLGIAKQIIEETKHWKQISHVEYNKEVVQKYILKAKLKNKAKTNDIVQVVILRKIDKTTRKSKDRFYSIHYRR